MWFSYAGGNTAFSWKSSSAENSGIYDIIGDGFTDGYLVAGYFTKNGAQIGPYISFLDRSTGGNNWNLEPNPNNAYLNKMTVNLVST